MIRCLRTCLGMLRSAWELVLPYRLFVVLCAKNGATSVRARSMDAGLGLFPRPRPDLLPDLPERLAFLRFADITGLPDLGGNSSLST